MTELLEITSAVDALKLHIRKNRGTCKNCKLPVFWCTTARGKRVPVDFPDKILHPEQTHELVIGWKTDGIWDGTVEVWPSARGTHTLHFDTCKGAA